MKWLGSLLLRGQAGGRVCGMLLFLPLCIVGLKTILGSLWGCEAACGWCEGKESKWSRVEPAREFAKRSQVNFCSRKKARPPSLLVVGRFRSWLLPKEVS